MIIMPILFTISCSTRNEPLLTISLVMSKNTTLIKYGMIEHKHFARTLSDVHILSPTFLLPLKLVTFK